MDLDLNIKKRGLGLLAVEKISFIYSLLTSLLILVLFSQMDHPLQMLLERLLIVGISLGLLFINRRFPNRFFVFIRVAFQLALLSYWYPDTFEFNRLFVNLDHLFAEWEQLLFGYQPAIVFSAKYSANWVSEAFHMGYFAYYPMIALVVIFYFFRRYEEFSRVAFILVGAFFIYYLLYIFIPVAGPQFYFPVIGFDQVDAGVFPPIGDFFNHNQVLNPGPGYDSGLFYNLVELSQQAGERPTAAFPSSHVGISTILMILAWRVKKPMFCILFPFYILLCGATVYIQAHYVIDIYAGWISAILIYAVVSWAYDRWFLKSEPQLN